MKQQVFFSPRPALGKSHIGSPRHCRQGCSDPCPQAVSPCTWDTSGHSSARAQSRWPSGAAACLLSCTPCS